MYLFSRSLIPNLDYDLLCLCLQNNKSWKSLYCFIIMLRLISYFLHTSSLLVSYAYISIKSIDCIFLSSFELEAILLISLAKRLWYSLLNGFTHAFWLKLITLCNFSTTGLWFKVCLKFRMWITNSYFPIKLGRRFLTISVLILTGKNGKLLWRS